MHNNMVNEVAPTKQVEEPLKQELFKYLRTCGNSTGNPPTTPGGMICPVSTGTILRMFEAPSKLRATISDIFSQQLMKTRMCTSKVEAIRLTNTQWDYALEVPLTSKELKKEGMNVVS